jgi:hypothetical protein
MKLEIELVPETSWYNNLRKALPTSEWDKIRKEAYKKANYKCEICGQEGRLSCHERWIYDDKKNIQKLVGFQALCDKCHNIKHIGFVNVQISTGKWSKTVMDDLTKHFMDVNKVTSKDFTNHVSKAFEVWRIRSKQEWTTDFGDWTKLIAKCCKK